MAWERLFSNQIWYVFVAKQHIEVSRVWMADFKHFVRFKALLNLIAD